ncbi:MAG: tetraacyldisaccharide 4'-kinase [Gammaproteobacteria bacterium]|nr:MAG: tetraacyldisaccharide 4'-kinase [Gammaproteobacteria bacterium]
MINWQQFWQHRKVGNIALLPLSALFYTLTTVRRACYRFGILKTEKAPLPIVVVGNINVGGAGKTPLVIALGKLLAQNGINYAVISKGYGGNYNMPTVVSSGDTADKVGDEPLLIKLKCACPVVVAKSRIEAARLVARQFSETQIILSDDGLQHYQLHRDMEICVINDSIGLGNGWLLPAGGLRESPARLNRVDFVVHNSVSEQTVKHNYFLTDRGWYHINSGKRRYHDEFSNDKSQNLAISGIAHPALFFQRLSTLGIYAETQPLPDHYAISANDLPADKTVLMTEKDWVKAKAFRHDDAWFLAVEAILSQPLQHDFLQKAILLIDKKSY